MHLASAGRAAARERPSIHDIIPLDRAHTRRPQPHRARPDDLLGQEQQQDERPPRRARHVDPTAVQSLRVPAVITQVLLACWLVLGPVASR